MDRTCKLILREMLSHGADCKCSLSQGSNRIGFSVSLGELSSALQIDPYIARKAVGYLVSTGYAAYINGGSVRGVQHPVAFQLTHKGIHWQEFRRSEILDYLADKWLDVLSSVIAFSSLIVSIIALWQAR